MSQNCECNPGRPVKLPVKGLELTVDTAGISCGLSREEIEQIVRDEVADIGCGCQPGAGRIKVTEDLHIYIDGKKTEAGDGLTPETAVTSVEEAWKALARYDGDNTHEAYVHFADLEGEERYPDFEVYPANYATFSKLHIRGESYASTRIGYVKIQRGAYATIEELLMSGLEAHGAHADVNGNIGISSRAEWAIMACYNGTIFLSRATIYVYGGTMISLIRSNWMAYMYISNDTVINIMAPTSFTNGFVSTHGKALLYVGNVTINGASYVTGQKYRAYLQSTISSYTTFPGSNGTLYNDAKYYAL